LPKKSFYGIIKKIKRELHMKVIFNPDNEAVELIKKGLERTGGYCPCKRERVPENVCMCEEFKAQIKDPDFEGFCHCMLYYKQK
jgi:ferredoxin-thioredoxin reductase catalytic subunit